MYVYVSIYIINSENSNFPVFFSDIAVVESTSYKLLIARVGHELILRKQNKKKKKKTLF
jgi:hypothetical protein